VKGMEATRCQSCGSIYPAWDEACPSCGKRNTYTNLISFRKDTKKRPTVERERMDPETKRKLFYILFAVIYIPFYVIKELCKDYSGRRLR
jgi:predicted ATP-dependent serine protease